MSVRTSDAGRVALKERLRHRKLNSVEHVHPVNVVHHDEATFGERLADSIASGIGSWRFLIIQTFAVTLWVILNLIGFLKHWDPFPFILLNLLFSVQAAYTGPVLLLAGNRQSQKDRLTLEHAAAEADKADQQNIDILRAIEKDTTLTERNVELAIQIIQRLQTQLTAHLESGTDGPQASDPELEVSGRT
jgi:uncharacterized membrane protein